MKIVRILMLSSTLVILFFLFINDSHATHYTPPSENQNYHKVVLTLSAEKSQLKISTGTICAVIPSEGITLQSSSLVNTTQYCFTVPQNNLDEEQITHTIELHLCAGWSLSQVSAFLEALSLDGNVPISPCIQTGIHHPGTIEEQGESEQSESPVFEPIVPVVSPAGSGNDFLNKGSSTNDQALKELARHIHTLERKLSEKKHNDDDHAEAIDNDLKVLSNKIERLDGTAAQAGSILNAVASKFNLLTRLLFPWYIGIERPLIKQSRDIAMLVSGIFGYATQTTLLIFGFNIVPNVWGEPNINSITCHIPLQEACEQRDLCEGNITSIQSVTFLCSDFDINHSGLSADNSKVVNVILGSVSLCFNPVVLPLLPALMQGIVILVRKQCRAQRPHEVTPSA